MTLTKELTLPNGVKYKQPTGLFINNDWIQSKGKDTIKVNNPATGKEIIQVLAASEEDVDIAVAAARKAFEGEWSEIGASERGKVLLKISQGLQRDIELYAAITAMENGKPLDAAKYDIIETIDVFRYYAGYVEKNFGQTIETTPAKFAYTLREPLGVCGQIIPWNFPLPMLSWKIAPALCCGNTVVLKSAEQTPLSALHFGNLIKEAGTPPGVVNILSGYGRVAGAALAAHMDVDKIAFTGSTATGRTIMKLASSNLKNITLECGGKSPNIIFDDADLDQAIKWAHMGCFFNQGQVCTSLTRLFVQEGIYDKIVKAVLDMAKQHKVGDPFEAGTFQGPQVTEVQHKRVMEYIEAGKAEGAKLLCGGSAMERDGYYIEPTIFTDVNDKMKIVKEEIFGPVLAIQKFKDESEVIQAANSTTYGLAASLFTKDVSRAHRVARKLQAGMVWINSAGDSHYAVPFGGHKSSGIGSELGDSALAAYSQIKAVHVNLGLQL